MAKRKTEPALDLPLTEQETALLKTALTIAAVDGSLYTGYEDSEADINARSAEIDRLRDRLSDLQRRFGWPRAARLRHSWRD